MAGVPQYLLVLYLAEQRNAPPTSPGVVAARLGRSPSAVTEMFGRLESRGHVQYEPYEGATLTADGRETASELHETYVTLSWFFRDVLDLDDHDQEALALAGAVSPAVAERLESTLALTEHDGPVEASNKASESE